MIENSGSAAVADEATRMLLKRIFPAFGKTAAGSSEASAIEGKHLIPLYVARPGRGQAGLALSGQTLISSGNCAGVPAGNYVYMLMDLPSLARATALGIGMTKPDEIVETGELGNGEGVMIHACETLPEVPPTRLISFEGEGGPVSIHFHDCRSAKGSQAVVFSVELTDPLARLMASPHGLARSANEMGAADAAARAKSVAKAVAGALPSDLSASLFQSEIENNLSGARMTVASVAVQDVLEEFEEIMGSAYDMVAPPSHSTIKRAITRQISECTITPQMIARNVAMSLIGENSLRAA